MADLYSVLGVARGASQKEIKSAFRKLAKQFHPDHNPDNKDVENKFSKISQAYEILGNSKKKAQYDKGEIDAEGKPIFQGFEGYNGFNQARGPYTQSGPANFGGRNFDASDIFRDFFGAGMGKSNPFDNSKQNLNKNISLEVFVTLEDIINNNKIDINLNNGKTLKIQLPKYLEEGQIIRLRGQGEHRYAGAPGDALLTLRIKKHSNFEIKHSDLYMDQEIELGRAVNGGKLFVQTLEGKVAITIPEWTDSGKLFRLKGKGLPMKKGGRGDLYVKLQIILPSEYKKQLKELFN